MDIGYAVQYFLIVVEVGCECAILHLSGDNGTHRSINTFRHAKPICSKASTRSCSWVEVWRVRSFRV